MADDEKLLKGQLVLTLEGGTHLDVGQWLKDHSYMMSVEAKNIQSEMLKTLKRIEAHLSIMTDEELLPGDEDL